MNTSQISPTINHNGPIQIICTQKCHDAIASDTALKGRARQYCILLSRNDTLSQKASEKMRSKVNLSELIAAGYLEIKAQTEGFNHSETPTHPIESLGQQSIANVSEMSQKNHRTANTCATLQIVATALRKAAISTHRIKPLRQVTDQRLTATEQHNKHSNPDSEQLRSHDANIISPILQFAAGRF